MVCFCVFILNFEVVCFVCLETVSILTKIKFNGVLVLEGKILVERKDQA
jgi:hypothetical protein